MKAMTDAERNDSSRMLSRWTVLAAAGLAIYSLVMLAIEANTSQAYVRNYFSDIEGEAPFYGINTSISVFFLWATALLFIISHCYLEKSEQNRTRGRFYLSQIVFFIYLGLDDRFKIHEGIGWRMDIADHYILMVAGIGQLLALVLWGRSTLEERSTFRYLCLGCVLSVAMLAIDMLAPEMMFMRLSIEDLCKTWAAFFFFLYGWAAMHTRLDVRGG